MADYQTLRDHDGADADADEQQRPADWRENVASLGKKFGESMTVVGGRITEGVSNVGDRVKDLFHSPSLGEKLAEDATSDVLIGPDWAKNLQICDLVNGGRVPGADVVRGIKKRLVLKNGHVQLLALSLLETALKNCSSMFSDVASEKVLDIMVRMVDDPTSPSQLRDKCLVLIESWGEASQELRYLPVFEETYKSLQTRGVVFPPRDPESLAPIFTPAQAAPPPGAPAAPARSYAATAAAARQWYPPPAAAAADAPGVFAYGGQAEADLAGPGVRAVDTPQGRVVVLDSKEILSVARNSTELLSTVITSAPPEDVLKDEVVHSLAQQCRASKVSVQRLVENESSNETLLFEALTVNDELDKVLEKLAQIQKDAAPSVAAPAAAAPAPAPAQPSDQLAGLLQPPQALPLGAAPPPVTSFAVPSMDHEPDAAEALVRKRAGTADGGASAAAAANDDERALAELDAMVFGRAPAAAPQPSSTSNHGDDKKAKEDDLIVF